MIFQSTIDPAVIKAIVTNPSIWPHVTDDFSPKPEDYEPPIGDFRLYVLAIDPNGQEGMDAAEVIGMWIFDLISPVCYKVHTCILPLGRGPRAARAAREMANWIWEHTTCRRIITDVPEDNRLALHFAEAAGMKEFGRNPASYKKNGKLIDVIELGMSRPGPEMVKLLHPEEKDAKPFSNLDQQTSGGIHR